MRKGVFVLADSRSFEGCLTQWTNLFGADSVRPISELEDSDSGASTARMLWWDLAAPGSIIPKVEKDAETWCEEGSNRVYLRTLVKKWWIDVNDPVFLGVCGGMVMSFPNWLSDAGRRFTGGVRPQVHGAVFTWARDSFEVIHGEYGVYLGRGDLQRLVDLGIGLRVPVDEELVG